MQAFALTDKGISRKNNQDFVYSETCSVGSLPNLFIVADGMGGHLGGDYASNYAVNRFVDLMKLEHDEEALTGIVDRCIQTVNSELFDISCNTDELYGMGTTLVMCYVKDGVVYAANIGDSRLYIINDSEIKQITRDHSLVEELLAQGSIDKDSPTYYQKKNIITRAVGVGDRVIADYFEINYNEGDVILLCSDGLTNMVSDSMIKEIVTGCDNLEVCARELVDMANNNGGTDNISVVLAR